MQRVTANSEITDKQYHNNLRRAEKCRQHRWGAPPADSGQQPAEERPQRGSNGPKSDGAKGGAARGERMGYPIDAPRNPLPEPFALRRPEVPVPATQVCCLRGRSVPLAHADGSVLREVRPNLQSTRALIEAVRAKPHRPCLAPSGFMPRSAAALSILTSEATRFVRLLRGPSESNPNIDSDGS